MSQKDLVLRHLQDFGSITSMDAFNDYGITRLSAVVYDLREAGYKIKTNDETRKNRYGVATTYARYTLDREPVQMELCEIGDFATIKEANREYH